MNKKLSLETFIKTWTEHLNELRKLRLTLPMKHWDALDAYLATGKKIVEIAAKNEYPIKKIS